MEHTEIIEYMRGDIRRTLEAEGVPQHQQDELIEHHLPHWLATTMGSMVVSMRVAEEQGMSERAARVLWNW
jgi:hypothetical protein